MPSPLPVLSPLIKIVTHPDFEHLLKPFFESINDDRRHAKAQEKLVQWFKGYRSFYSEKWASEFLLYTHKHSWRKVRADILPFLKPWQQSLLKAPIASKMYRSFKTQIRGRITEFFDRQGPRDWSPRTELLRVLVNQP